MTIHVLGKNQLLYEEYLTVIKKNYAFPEYRLLHLHQFISTLVNSKVYPSELLSVKDQTSAVSKHSTEIVNHLLIVKYAL